jgi:glycosyltransferase involved in cell wall biosynthesis
MIKNEKRDLVVVTTEPFPNGMAATNRMISYLKFIAKKCNIEVMVVKPTEREDNPRNLNSIGDFQNIYYKYIDYETIWPTNSSRVKKLFIILRGYYLLFFALLKAKPKSVLLISNSYVLIKLIFLYSKLIKFKIYQEKSELPPVLKAKHNSYYRAKYLKVYRGFSGMIVMTKQLEKYFKDIGQTKVFNLPMSIDFSRFSKIKKTKSYDNMVFKYCGGGNYERDGLLFTIKAFMQFYSIVSNFEFHVIGPINRSGEYLKKIFKLIKENNADTYIKFLGEKDSKDIPKLLQNADCLIMTPSKDFESGGFPTKLGEYLATGNPVICTRVGEISMYLDSRSAILIKPNSVEDIVQAISSVYCDYNKFIAIGKEGRKVALKHFNPECYSDDLIKFLEI